MDTKQRIKILQDIVQIKSVNDNEAEVANYFVDLFKEYGIESEIIEYSPGRSNIIAEHKFSEGPIFVFNGHLDVVAAGDESDWTYPPFDAVVKNGYMHGRGTADMKAGLMAGAIALIELKEADADIHGTIRFIGNVGEEMGMLGSEQLTEEGYLNDVDAMVIGEPTGIDNVMIGHKGSIQYRIISKGTTAHSSMPSQGINAITQLTRLMENLTAEFDRITEAYYNDLLGTFINVFTIIEGGSQINSVPADCVVSANARTIPEFDNDQTIEVLNKFVAEANERTEGSIELEIMQSTLPVLDQSDTRLAQIVANTGTKDYHLFGSGGATDAANFYRANDKIEIVIYGPGVTELAHKVDEKVEIAEYEAIIDRYKEIALTYLSGE